MNLKDIDFNKCLDELEQIDWGEAPAHSTGLIIKAHELRKLPLQYWTNEDFRLMILQQISLEYLVPIALYRLANNPFNSGELFVGDLLYTIVRIEEDFWKQHVKLHYELDCIIDSLKADIETLSEILSQYKYSYD
ncbi:contact-dependent growth inhibition system immunity protein [Paenibacillus sp. BAC0078]